MILINAFMHVLLNLTVMSSIWSILLVLMAERKVWAENTLGVKAKLLYKKHKKETNKKCSV